MILHFILFYGLQNTSFVRFLVNSKKVIFHPVYQKAVFDELAVGVRTDFASRVEGKTCEARDVEVVLDYLLMIANSDINEYYRNICSFERFGFVVGGRDLQLSFQSFKSLVNSLNKDSADELFGSLLKVNNRVISNLDSVTGRHASLDVISESYNSYYKTQLGVYKFRNISEDIYAIQDRGWDSYNPTSANLAFIILNLFRPAILSIDNSGRQPLSTVGGKSLIPNDVLLDLGLLTSEECLLSLFSMRAPSSDSGSSVGKAHNSKGNYMNRNSSGSVIGNSGPTGKIAQDQTVKRDYSTTHARKAYFGRYLCLEHIKLIYFN